MATKIYKVTVNILCVEDCENLITSKIFTDKELAMKYYRELIDEDKELEFNQEDYIIEEEECYYERYLEGYAAEDSISIWIEEDEICEELEKNIDTEKSYEM